MMQKDFDQKVIKDMKEEASRRQTNRFLFCGWSGEPSSG